MVMEARTVLTSGRRHESALRMPGMFHIHIWVVTLVAPHDPHLLPLCNPLP